MSQPNKELKKSLIFLGSFVAVILVAATAISIPLIVSASRRGERIETAMQGQPDAIITAGQMMDDRDGSAYDDRVVIVSGVVQAVSLNAANVLLYLGDQSGSQDAVLCFFKLNEGPQIKAIEIGTPLKIRGLASTGAVPLLHRCRIEP